MIGTPLQIRELEDGEAPLDDNVLKGAPHTVRTLTVLAVLTLSRLQIDFSGRCYFGSGCRGPAVC